MKPITLHTEPTPRFKHDCQRCRYLGTIVSSGGLADLYFCDQSGSRPTVIARFSDEGSDYASGLVDLGDEFRVGTAELFVAATLARKNHLV